MKLLVRKCSLKLGKNLDFAHFGPFTHNTSMQPSTRARWSHPIQKEELVSSKKVYSLILGSGLRYIAVQDEK